jgi:hypothetical protein
MSQQRPIATGDIRDARIVYVSGYGCWCEIEGVMGFMPYEGWSSERPIPESAVPLEGQRLPVRVVHVLGPDRAVPEWATFGGRYNIKFTAAIQGVAT